ncbi:MAG: hypothetical protein H6934_07645 [Burkholderiaceae bacterium]|nr:hypothetical protein [Burkholderiaceae bacterium]
MTQHAPAAVGPRHRALVAAVQRNCNLADARHAQGLTMCIYLLQMREHFRWEQGLPLAAPLDRRAVGRWIGEREALWQDLDDTPDAALEMLPLDGGADPFDESLVNAALDPDGLAYGAGLARLGAPVFVVAERLSDQRRDGVRVRVLGREYARGLNPPVAASNDAGILIRRDAMRRWLATRQELSVQRAMDDAFSIAYARYAGVDPGDALPTGDAAVQALERLVDGEIETLVLHELGEVRAEALLGPDWPRMLGDGLDPRIELRLRALRDLLADSLVTLPVLCERAASTSLHFWFATFEGLRRQLAPDWVRAYRDWSAGQHDALARVARAGRRHWLELARRCLDAWRQGGSPALAATIRADLDPSMPAAE